MGRLTEQAPGRGRSPGFTAIELMVVVAILSIVVAVAVPSFTRFIQGSSVTSTVNTFLADLRFARSEAIRRGGHVVLCRSDAPEAASPVCATGEGPGGAGWATGWLVFHDLDANGTRQESDPVLKVRRAWSALDSVSDGGASTAYRFTALGRLTAGTPTTSMSFGGPAVATEARRTLCVFPTGTTRVVPAGGAPCG